MRRRKKKGCLGRLVALSLVAVVALVFFQETGGSLHDVAAKAERLLYPVAYRSAILDSSARHDVDPQLVCAVIKTETNWNPADRSPVGAEGLMQVMPATAEELVRRGYVDGSRYSPHDLFDPVTNIEFGCAYLEFAGSRFDTTAEIAASYNAGIGKVWEWKSLGAGSVEEMAEEYPETSAYIRKVETALERYRTLYTTDLRPRD